MNKWKFPLNLIKKWQTTHVHKNSSKLYIFTASAFLSDSSTNECIQGHEATNVSIALSHSFPPNAYYGNLFVQLWKKKFSFVRS